MILSLPKKCSVFFSLVFLEANHINHLIDKVREFQTSLESGLGLPPGLPVMVHTQATVQLFA